MFCWRERYGVTPMQANPAFGGGGVMKRFWWGHLHLCLPKNEVSIRGEFLRSVSRRPFPCYQEEETHDGVCWSVSSCRERVRKKKRTKCLGLVHRSIFPCVNRMRADEIDLDILYAFHRISAGVQYDIYKQPRLSIFNSLHVWCSMVQSYDTTIVLLLVLLHSCCMHADWLTALNTSVHIAHGLLIVVFIFPRKCGRACRVVRGKGFEIGRHRLLRVPRKRKKRSVCQMTAVCCCCA